MKIPTNVLTFAKSEDNLKAYKMFADYYNQYRATVEGVKGLVFQTQREDGTTISFSEKEDKMSAELRKEILRVSGYQSFDQFPMEAWVSNPMVSWATFAVVGMMIDMILPETLIENIGMYTEVRNGNYGDSFAFEATPRDLFVVSKAGRTQRVSEVHKQFKGGVTILPEPRQLSVQVSLYKVLCGKESLAEFVAKVVRSMESAVAMDVYTVFATAMAALPTTPAAGFLRVAGYTQDSLVAIGQRVAAYNGGAKPIVVGTQLALETILPANSNYRYEIDSDFVKLGYVRTAFGFDTLVLPQVAKWTSPFELAIDDKKLYIISPSSQKLVKLCLEGATTSNQIGPFQNANLTQSTTMWKSWGAGIATNAIAGCITLP